MLVSTKGRYALRVMIDLAENSTGWVYSAERHCRQTGYFGKVFRKHYFHADQGGDAGRASRQRRRL